MLQYGYLFLHVWRVFDPGGLEVCQLGPIFWIGFEVVYDIATLFEDYFGVVVEVDPNLIICKQIPKSVFAREVDPFLNAGLAFLFLTLFLCLLNLYPEHLTEPVSTGLDVVLGVADWSNNHLL